MSLFQSSSRKSPIQLSLVVISGLGILSYIIYKASHTSFTHDESYTYTRYVHQSFMDIISYKTPYTNNHILNTVLMKYCEMLFGSSELSLRLPNIFAFVIYSVFSILFFYNQSPKLTVSFYLLMSCNPYLIEFFALARGYGLSIGFLVMSLYYLNLHFKSKQNNHLILFNVGAFLAVMSNFSLLNYYVAALLIFNIIHYIISKIDRSNSFNNFYSLNKINLISVVVSGMVLYEPIRRISKINLLDFGGKNGFIDDTIGTAIHSFFYEMYVSPFYEILLKTFIILTVSLSLILIVKNLIQKNISFLKTHLTLILINAVLLTIVFITILQHLLLGNDYYIHRFALFFYPLFILNFTFILFYLYEIVAKNLIMTCGYLFSALAVFNLYINHSNNSYKDWRFDSNVKIIMQKLALEHEQNSDKKIKLGINWLFEPSTNFYRSTWDLNWLNETHRDGIDKNDDYLIMFKTDEEFKTFGNLPVLYEDKVSGIVLLKNKN
jgi:hypothetical protein